MLFQDKAFTQDKEFHLDKGIDIIVQYSKDVHDFHPDEVVRIRIQKNSSILKIKS